MIMEILDNILLKGLHKKDIAVDIYFKESKQPKPVIIFCHGFKGFKDWGAFSQMAKEFAAADFVFVKFNFSHNGTSISNPTEFVDLEAFGNNNFLIELDDLKVMIDAIFEGNLPIENAEIDVSQLYLIGHSRGGGIAILKSAEDERIKKLITWASVSEFGKFWSPSQMNELKENGVLMIPNARTGQQMPIYAQLYETFSANKDRLDIPSACQQLNIPFCIVHGDDDSTVNVSAANELKSLNPTSDLNIIAKGDHTFGMKHPWEKDSLPKDLEEVIKISIDFLKQ